MTTIQVKCVDQNLQILNSPMVASGGIQETSMQFEFCPKWDGLGKTAVFYKDRSKVYNVALDGENKCLIPDEVMQEAGRIYFGVYGTSETKRKTTFILKYDIQEGAFFEGDAPSEPTPNIYAQIIQQYQSIDATYKNIYNELEDTVANMSAKGFVNLNENGEVVRFWVGTLAEYNALEEIENGVNYVITDVESNSVPYYSITNSVENKNIEAVLLFAFKELEASKPFVINLSQGANDKHYSFLGCSKTTQHMEKGLIRSITLYNIDDSQTITSSYAENEISALTINDITYTSKTYATTSTVSTLVNKTTPKVVETITESGLYHIALNSQDEIYSIVMYIDVNKVCYTNNAVVTVEYYNGQITLNYINQELQGAVTGYTITRLLGV